jgi:ubiquinone/menaquinone biosynthesis C-methylase UbiE
VADRFRAEGADRYRRAEDQLAREESGELRVVLAAGPAQGRFFGRDEAFPRDENLARIKPELHFAAPNKDIIHKFMAQFRDKPRIATDPKATAATRQRYQRIAPFYDLMEFLPERHFSPWRERLWSMVEGPRVLEVGVGTGKNMEHYPSSMDITAIDLTPAMVERSKVNAEKRGLVLGLHLMDAQSLAFDDESFDSVLATCVFCSVPDPLLGLSEVMRVTRRGGKILLMEHVRSEKRLMGVLMDILNPIVLQIMGPNINRRTVENVQKAGLEIEKVEDIGIAGIFKLIIARRT